jgi:hypothetical protein
MPEAGEPAPQQRGQILDRALQRSTAPDAQQFAQPVLEPGHALQVDPVARQTLTFG